MENTKNVLFLGGLGAPVAIFLPWFKSLKSHGYNICVVPNSLFCFNDVSDFAQSFISYAEQFDAFDVIAISYGGNAALYGAYLSAEVREKTNKMLLVCSPILGAPILVKPLRRLIPSPFAQKFNEMAADSDVTTCIKSLDEAGQIPFDLHCIYHNRDLMAPLKVATLANVGTNHQLDFNWSAMPSLLMHQALYVNPRTLKKVIAILTDNL